MNPKPTQPADPADLRRRAEETARAVEFQDRRALSPEEVRQLIHELRVHQIQLEMQNDELRRTQEELESSRSRYFDLYDLAPVGYVTVSEPGLILHANLTAATLLGVVRTALDNQALTRFILPEDQDVYYRHRQRLFETRSPQMCELRMIQPDGRPFWARLDASLARDNDGTTVCRVVISDITASKESEKALKVLQAELEERVRQRTAELAASEERFRMMVEGIRDYAIIMLDIEGRIQSWNAGAERINGYRADEVIGRHFSLLYPQEEIENGRPEQGLAVAVAQERFKDEGWRRRKDGSRFFASVVITALRDGNGRLRGFAKVTRDITERKQSQENIRKLSHQLLKAQEDERQMISMELHDTVAQDLSVIKINLGMLFDQPAMAPLETTQKISRLSQMIDRCIATVRNLSYGLRPPGLKELGLIQTISTHCEDFAKNTGIFVDFQAAGLKMAKIDSFVEINLYRLIQEGLNNVRKHAAADRVIIRLLGAYPDIVLRIEDNGKGFDMQARDQALDGEKRMGLRSMKERVNLLHGQMTVESYPMKGTRILVKFPFKEDNHESEKTHHHYR